MHSGSRVASSKADLPKALGEAGEREYLRLLRVLGAAEGMFALVPVASDFPVGAREMLLGRLADDLGTKGIGFHTARLTRERWDVIKVLSEIAPPVGTPAVLAVMGLEDTPGIVPEPGAPRRRPPALALLNNAREGLRGHFPFPLLIWCEPRAFAALQEEAPDLYDHFIGLFEFIYAGPRLPLGLKGYAASHVEREDISPVALGPPRSAAVASFYSDLLARHPDPSEERARALLGFAEALWGLHTADVTSRLLRALGAVEEALNFLSHEPIPHEVARGQAVMGLILSDLPTTNRLQNLQRAIGYYEAALRIWTERDFPVQ